MKDDLSGVRDVPTLLARKASEAGESVQVKGDGGQRTESSSRDGSNELEEKRTADVAGLRRNGSELGGKDDEGLGDRRTEGGESVSESSGSSDSESEGEGSDGLGTGGKDRDAEKAARKEHKKKVKEEKREQRKSKIPKALKKKKKKQAKEKGKTKK